MGCLKFQHQCHGSFKLQILRCALVISYMCRTNLAHSLQVQMICTLFTLLRVNMTKETFLLV